MLDAGARRSVWSSPDPWSGNAYVQATCGSVRQRLLNGSFTRKSWETTTNPACAPGVGGYIATPRRFAFVFHLEDRIVRFTPVTFGYPPDRQPRSSHNVVWTLGLAKYW